MKNSLKFKRGFTLVEILIVIAIIGILASIALIGLGGSRVKARDAKRISEVRQIQTALELYLNRCGYYPGPANCAGVLWTAASAPTDWSATVTALEGDASITNIPAKDPSGQDYIYGVSVDGQSYIIGAKLEQGNAVIQGQDINTSGYSPSISCSTATSPTNNYCVHS